MLFKGAFTLAVLMTLASAALVGGRTLGFINDAPAATSGPCDSLTEEQRKTLLGERTPYEQDLGEFEDSEVCRWSLEAGDEDTFVEVSVTSAQQWAADYAGSIAEQGGPSDAARRAVFRKALELGDGASDREACGLASRVFELNGAEQGAQRGVTFDEGNRRKSPRVVAEGCTDGVFVSVVAAAPDLKSSSTLDKRALQALTVVQRRLG
jgi:hypothetical protein